MKAKELAAVSGKTVVAIRGAYYRFYDTKTGWSIAKELGDEFVNYILKSSSGDTPKPKPNRKTEPKAEPQKEVQTEPENKPEPNRTKPEEPEPELQTEPKPDVKQTEPNQAEPFDLGDWLFFHPTANFLFVVLLLSAGAWIFANLASKLYQDGFSNVAFVFFFSVGFLADSSGIIYARKYKRAGKFDDASSVRGLLWFLFIVQTIIEAGNMFYGKSITFIGVVFVLVRPLAQLIYSEMYLNSKR